MLNFRTIQTCRYFCRGTPKLYPRLKKSSSSLEDFQSTPVNEDEFEIHHPTLFGSVRLDSRNSPKFSKPGDELSFSKKVPAYSAPPLAQNNNAPETIYFEEDELEEYTSKDKSLQTDKSESVPDNRSSLGFIDEQYFNALPERSFSPSNEPSIDCSKSLKETRELMRDSTRELNPIDEQLFPSKNPSSKKKKLKPSQKNGETALDYIKKRMKAISPGENFENASLKTKEQFVQEINDSLQKRLMKVHDHYFEVPEIHNKNILQNDSTNDEPLVTFTKGLNGKYKARNLQELTSMEMEKKLRDSIIYNKDGIIAINKPYGLSMSHDKGLHHSIEKYLPTLSDYLEIPSGKLSPAHRLDKTTTGVLLLSSSEKSHDYLTGLFRSRKMVKIYWAITNGVPEPPEGVIDIPIREEKINGRFRSMLIPSVKTPLKSRKRSFTQDPARPAVTEFKTLKTNYNAALLEVNASTGFKHQIRVHLGFGLSTPILGDHKYSDIRGIGKPQKVNGEILMRLKSRASKSRQLPLLLHARELILPCYEKNHSQDLRIVAGLPHHFSCIKMRLKL